jgi:tetratricopeptide (TPR) repeat protein
VASTNALVGSAPPSSDIAAERQPGEPLPVFDQIPRPAAPFVGRSALIAALSTRLQDEQIVVLCGIAGSGKQTLAAHLAHHPALRSHFSDGVLWATLGPQADPVIELGRWAAALAIDVSRLPDAQQRAEAIQRATGDRRLLLVIDDAWSLDTATFLCCGGPNCAYLLTTQDRSLAVAFAGETQTVAVPPLTVEAAHALLQQLAPAACASDPASARALSAATGGLPLALVLLGAYLAAPEISYFAHLPHHPPAAEQEPVRRLARAAAQITAHGAPPTMAEVLTLCLDGLPGEAVEAFYALAAFAPKPASFSLAAAEAVSGASGRLLSLLIDRRLVEAYGGVGGQWMLHPVLADLARPQTPSEAMTRHREYYLRWLTALDDTLLYERVNYAQLRWLWQTAPPSSRLAILFALGDFHMARGLWREAISWIEQTLSTIDQNEQPTVAALLLNNLGWFYDRVGAPWTALTHYRQSLAIMRQVGDVAGEVTTLNNIARAYAALGEKKLALATYEQLCLIQQAHGEQKHTSATLNNIGLVYADLGDKQQAHSYFAQSLQIARQHQERKGEATTLNNLARLMDSLGHKRTALTHYEEALRLYRQIEDRTGEATTLNNIGRIYHDLGEAQRALTFFAQALPLRRQMGDRRGEAATLNNIGGVYDHLGRQEQALTHYEQALAICQAVGDRWSECRIRYNLAMLRGEMGDLAAAEAHLCQVIAIEEAVGHPDLASDRATLSQVQEMGKNATVISLNKPPSIARC